MDVDSRKKLIAKLAAERGELERKAAELEKQAEACDESKDKEGDRKWVLDVEAKAHRARASELGRQWADLVEEEMHDDDRQSGAT
jgi:hypothetical protein